MTLQCPLGKCQPVPIDAEAVKRDGWNRQGILVVSRDDQRLDWVQRESVRQIGDMIYGERKGKRGAHATSHDLKRLSES